MKYTRLQGPGRLALLIAAVCSLFSVSPLEVGATEYRFERMWPTLQQPWYFGTPGDVTYDQFSDHVYVLDSFNHRVEKYTRDGQFVLRWGVQGDDPGEFFSPQGICVDYFSNVYVADTGNDRIQKFTPNGEFIMEWGSFGTGASQFDEPTGIEIDYYGGLWVTDKKNHRIHKYDFLGNFIGVVGTQGSGPLQFNEPWDICIDNYLGYVFVSDSLNDRIQVLDLNGFFWFNFGGTGTGPKQFDYPIGLEMDFSGYLHVVDESNNRIQTFYPNVSLLDYDFVHEFGMQGSGESQFWSPRGLAVDRDYNLYIADWLNSRLQKVTWFGDYLDSWTSSGPQLGRFGFPRGIARDSQGRIYVAEFIGERVTVFSPQGEPLETFAADDGGNGIAIDSNDNIFVVTESNLVRRYTRDINGVVVENAQFDGTAQGQTPLNAPWSVACDATGDVYVADFNNDRIQVFSNTGTWERTIGTAGSGDGQLNNPSGVFVYNGELYVADGDNDRVQVFTLTGNFVRKWGSDGSGPGQFDGTAGITVDASGNVYTGDLGNGRINVFNTQGVFQGDFGELGTAPGQFFNPIALSTDASGNVLVAELSIHRVQAIKPIAVSSNAKAVIVAAGGPFPGNNLWDATQFCANFAYRSLLFQGYDKGAIQYLSSNQSLDLDSNGLPDDVDADATNANLQQAITQWATGASELVIYLVNHGGQGTFRMSESETLSAASLAGWVNAFQNQANAKIIAIYDACQSGSFLTALQGANRIVMTSATGNENAHFLSGGSISFSNFFWTQVFNGYSVTDSFNYAKDSLGQSIQLQTPQLYDPGNVAATTFIGNGTPTVGDRPVINSVTPPQNINGVTTATIDADVTDPDGLARVWIVIQPPGYAPPSADNPVQDFPSLDLTPDTGNTWTGEYADFTIPGTYNIAVYARDRAGDTSVPVSTAVTVNNPLRRRAIILATGTTNKVAYDLIKPNADLAYSAMKQQGFSDDDIYFMSPVANSPGHDASPTLATLDFRIQQAATSGQDLTLFLVGRAGADGFDVNDTEVLTPATLKGWLDTLQNTLPGPVVCIFDFNGAGNFVNGLTPPTGKSRILVGSTKATGSAAFTNGGRVSFSHYFWSQVLNGAHVHSAFGQSFIGMQSIGTQQVAQIDDNGNGTPNEKEDGGLARNYRIGAGVLLAGDAPQIGKLVLPAQLQGQTSLTIRAEGVTSTTGIAQNGVWATLVGPAVLPPGEGQVFSTLPTVTLNPLGNNVFENVFAGLGRIARYKVTVFAKDIQDNVSFPKSGEVIQVGAAGQPDFFEDDDVVDRAVWFGINGPLQTHNFHDPGDVDWLRFYGETGDGITVETVGLGSTCDTVVEVYNAAGTTLLASNDDRFPGDLSSYLVYTVPATGLFTVKVRHNNPATSGQNTYYDVRVWREIGPALDGFMLVRVVNGANGSILQNASVTITKTDEPAYNFNTTTNFKGETSMLTLKAATGGTSYQVTARSLPFFGDTSVSSQVFSGSTSQPQVTINPIPGTGSITVTAPNGGENWVHGAFVPVQWTANAPATQNVRIELLKGGALSRTLTGSTPNNGSFNWQVPTDLVQGTDYTVRVSSLTEQNVSDTSNGNFNVSGGTTPPPPPPPSRKSAIEMVTGTIAEEVLPADNDGGIIARDQAIAVRVRGFGPIDPGSVQCTVEGSLGYAAGGAQWIDVTGDGTDGWAVFTPAVPYAPNETLTVSVHASLADGTAVEPLVFEFVTGLAFLSEPDSEPALELLSGHSALSESWGEGVGDVYRLSPVGPFDVGVPVQLPVPAGYSPSDLRVFYHSESDRHAGWYPAEAVEGWVAPGSVREVTVDGAAYLEFEAHHSGVVQLGAPSEVGASGVVLVGRLSSWAAFAGVLAGTLVLTALLTHRLRGKA
ncbi:MAG: hypothetical protein AMXMBFR84_18240 [Candidatus Hydrogenedentota bacterium]